MHATTNGRVRKSLADQLDRMDRVLDGLAEGLNDAIATAVTEAVRAVLKEILAQPEVVARIKAENAATKHDTSSKPKLAERLSSACRQVWARVKALLGAASRAVVSGSVTAGQTITRVGKSVSVAAKGIRDRVIGSIVGGLCYLWLLRRLATSSAGVFILGFGIGLATAYVSPWMIALVGGVGAWRWWR
jgi:hypothetical protein